MRQPSRFLECGQMINIHGCHGDIKVDPWTDTPEDFTQLKRVFIGDGEEKTEKRLTRTAVLQGRFLLLHLEGVDDIDSAETLRGTILYAAREDYRLKEGQYFLSDAVGLPVVDDREGQNGRVLGTVREIMPGTASDLFVVVTPSGEVLVPAVPAFISSVIPGDCVHMTPIDGMFDGETDDSNPISHPAERNG